jgi:tetratricopeptide (TPR) repeat protein
MSARTLILVLSLVVTSAGCAGGSSIAVPVGVEVSPADAEAAYAAYQEGLAALEAAQQANRRMVAKEYARARKALKRSVKLDPGNLDAHVKLVRALDGVNREKDLLERLRGVLAVDSLHVEANELLANRTYGTVISYVTVGTMEAARPGNSMNSRQRAVLKAQGVKFEELDGLVLEARAICDRLLRIDPEETRYMCALGAVMNLQGDYQGASALYYQVQRNDPDFLKQNDFHNTVFAVSREKRIFVSANTRSFLFELGGRSFRLIR